MKRKLLIGSALLLGLNFSACKKQSTREVIIVDEPEETIDTTTVALNGTESTQEATWGGAKCSITVSRHVDKERPVVVDENGRKYYDTAILIRVVNKDGKVFFERDFTKDDFKPYVSSRWAKSGALLGLPFDGIDNDQLVFRGCVGSPDPLSDDLEHVAMYLNLSASYQLARDTKPEMYIPGMEEDEGV